MESGIKGCRSVILTPSATHWTRLVKLDSFAKPCMLSKSRRPARRIVRLPAKPREAPRPTLLKSRRLVRRIVRLPARTRVTPAPRASQIPPPGGRSRAVVRSALDGTHGLAGSRTIRRASRRDLWGALDGGEQQSRGSQPAGFPSARD
jgi:hypothetical protein